MKIINLFGLISSLNARASIFFNSFDQIWELEFTRNRVSIIHFLKL